MTQVSEHMQPPPRGVRGLVTQTPTGPHVPQPPQAAAEEVSADGIPLSLIPAQDDAILARAKARARLAAHYARLQGHAVLPHQIVAVLANYGATEVLPPPNVVATALSDLGVRADVTSVGAFTADQWPALAEMTGGQLILVLGQGETTLSVYDPTRPGAPQDIALAEFAPFFTGTLIRIAQRRTASTRWEGVKQHLRDHWLWTAVPQLHHPVRMVALAAAAVNALAFCLALGALAIYGNGLPAGTWHGGVVLGLAVCFVLACDVFFGLYVRRLVRRSRAALTQGARRAALEAAAPLRADLRPATPQALDGQIRNAALLTRMFRPGRVALLADLPGALLALALVFAIVGNAGWLVVLMGLFTVGSTVAFATWRRHQFPTAHPNLTGGAAKAALQALTQLPSPNAMARFRDAWESLTSPKPNQNEARVIHLLGHWPKIALTVSLISVTALYGYLGLGGQLTLGAIVAAGILSGRALAPLTDLPDLIRDWPAFRDAMGGSARPAAPIKVQGLVELHHIAHRTGLTVKNLTVQPGERLALLDDGGPATESLFGILAGQVAADAGQVWIDGVAPSQITPLDQARDIGYLPRQTQLFDGTLRDNLRVGDHCDADLMTALDFAGLGTVVRQHPRGLDLGIGDAALNGCAAAIGWARLWLQNPPLVFLDRPRSLAASSAVATVRDVWLAQRTVVMLTDRMPLLNTATRILVLQGGQAMVDGPADQVIRFLNTPPVAPATSAPASQMTKGAVI
ncbi:ATP-binding cassette domain-containing protein [Actibacterium sp. 188UL27-1]|uniref:ATP-binding cassette domain-containing protein n=1 Tax=Actibacterium sp. 188UL27-1 TaxID=2786961 RepID=UPI00195924CC|nr:ATP-binding cassette domain-containing protein [Actibacterium sp. 188UL27-1]MBM7068148.1 hypothetical protein [Actibacterium sp. 188UL27-1]